MAEERLSPFTISDLVKASEGCEGNFLIILRDATEQIKNRLRQRVLGDVEALGGAGALEEVAWLLDGNEPGMVQKPARERKPAAKPTPPADDAELLKLLLTDLDRGAPLTGKALARRTGAPADRVTRVLRQSQDADVRGGVPARIALNGLKWSRKVTT